MLGLVTLLSGFSVSATQPRVAAWQKLRSMEAGIEILLPYKPVVKKERFNSAHYIQFNCNLRREYVFVAAVITSDKALDEQAGLKAAQTLRDSTLSAIDRSASVGIPRGSKPKVTSRDGVTGEEIEFSQYQLDVFGRVWVGYTSTKIYLLLAGISADSRAEATADTNKFFNSFKVLKE